MNQKTKKAVMITTGLMILTVLLNYWLGGSLNSSMSPDSNRGVASFEPTFSVKELKWEQELAGALSKKQDLKAALPTSVSVLDELLFGYLEGKYGLRAENGKVKTLEFRQDQMDDHPLAISNKIDFLNHNKKALGLNFFQVKLVSNRDQIEVYQLLGQDQNSIGEVQFKLDKEGRVLSVEF